MNELIEFILYPTFLRQVLIGGALGGFLVSATCWLLWRWKARDPARRQRHGVEQTKVMGKLCGYNTLVLACVALYFIVRYVVMDYPASRNSEGLLQLGVVAIYGLIIVGLCLPGLVSLISGGGRRVR